MRHLNYIFNGEKYVFSGTQYENPDKGTMRMQYTTQRTFTTTENVTTSFKTQTYAETLTRPDGTEVPRYNYHTSSKRTTIQATKTSSGTVKYGLTTDPNARQYSPMPFVKNGRTLYLGRSWTSYERGTDPVEVEKIKTIVSTTYTTSKDFNHRATYEYETDAKKSYKQTITYGQYYSQVQTTKEYEYEIGQTTGGKYLRRSVTFTATDALVSFNQTNQSRGTSNVCSFTVTVTRKFYATQTKSVTGSVVVNPGWYCATSDENGSAKTVTLYIAAQSASNQTIQYPYTFYKDFALYKTTTLNRSDPWGSDMSPTIMSQDIKATGYLMTGTYNDYDIHAANVLVVSNSMTYNTQSGTASRRMRTNTQTRYIDSVTSRYTYATYYKNFNKAMELVSRCHSYYTSSTLRTDWLKSTNEKWRITRTSMSVSSTYMTVDGASYQTDFDYDVGEYDMPFWESLPHAKYLHASYFKNNYLTYTQYRYGTTYYYNASTIESTMNVDDVEAYALENPVVSAYDEEGTFFWPNHGDSSYDYCFPDTCNTYWKNNIYTGYGKSVEFIEKTTEYAYSTSSSWDENVDKVTFISTLPEDQSQWITNEASVPSPLVTSQRSYTRTSKIDGLNDWKATTTIPEYTIEHVTRTKTSFPIITDAQTTMLSTERYISNEYPITRTYTTHNFNV